MQLREALITMSPSLALQRQAADEIARLDAKIEEQKFHILQLAEFIDRVTDEPKPVPPEEF